MKPNYRYQDYDQALHVTSMSTNTVPKRITSTTLVWYPLGSWFQSNLLAFLVWIIFESSSTLANPLWKQVLAPSVWLKVKDHVPVPPLPYGSRLRCSCEELNQFNPKKNYVYYHRIQSEMNALKCRTMRIWNDQDLLQFIIDIKDIWFSLFETLFVIS